MTAHLGGIELRQGCIDRPASRGRTGAVRTFSTPSRAARSAPRQRPPGRTGRAIRSGRSRRARSAADETSSHQDGRKKTSDLRGPPRCPLSWSLPERQGRLRRRSCDQLRRPLTLRPRPRGFGAYKEDGGEQGTKDIAGAHSGWHSVSAASTVQLDVGAASNANVLVVGSQHHCQHPSEI